jgi:hypothetical protein
VNILLCENEISLFEEKRFPIFYIIGITYILLFYFYYRLNKLGIKEKVSSGLFWLMNGGLAYPTHKLLKNS